MEKKELENTSIGKKNTQIESVQSVLENKAISPEIRVAIENELNKFTIEIKNDINTIEEKTGGFIGKPSSPGLYMDNSNNFSRLKELMSNKTAKFVTGLMLTFISQSPSFAKNVDSSIDAELLNSDRIEVSHSESTESADENSYNFDSDPEKDPNHDKEKNEKVGGVIDFIDLVEEHEIAVGDLGDIEESQMKEKVSQFIDGLSPEGLQDIIDGKTLVNVYGSCSREVVNSPIEMEDGSSVNNNKELAEYRAYEASRLFIKTLDEKGHDISGLNFSVSIPNGDGARETGVSPDNKRLTRIELKNIEEKNIGNILELFSGKLAAMVEDQSGSINKQETKKISDFISLTSEKDPNFKHAVLQGGNNEALLNTLSDLIYKSELEKGNVLVIMDERDASNHHASYEDQEQRNRVYKKRMNTLMEKYSKTGNSVYVGVFNPDGGSDFKIINLNDSPEAMMIDEKTEKAYREVVKNRKGEERWYKGLRDQSAQILSGSLQNNDVNSVKYVSSSHILKNIHS